MFTFFFLPTGWFLSFLRFFFFFNDTATTEIYTLSLHDALPILRFQPEPPRLVQRFSGGSEPSPTPVAIRSEEHTSELQSLTNLVCRLLLEKKKIEEDCTGVCRNHLQPQGPAQILPSTTFTLLLC